MVALFLLYLTGDRYSSDATCLLIDKKGAKRGRGRRTWSAQQVQVLSVAPLSVTNDCLPAIERNAIFCRP